MSTTTIDPRVERTHSLVLDATAALIGEVGFGRTSIEAIAERSGVARSTIYRHWSDRLELLTAAINGKIAHMAIPATGDLRRDLLAVLGELADRLGSPEIGPMMISLIAKARRDPQMTAVYERFASARMEQVRSILELAADRGDLPAGLDANQMTEDLVAPLFFRAFIRLAPLDESFLQAHIDRWIEAYRGS